MQAVPYTGATAEGTLHSRYRPGEAGHEGYWWVEVPSLGYRVICSPDDIRIGGGEWREKEKVLVQLPGGRTGEMGTRGEVWKLDTRDVVEVSEEGRVIGRWDGKAGGQETRSGQRPTRGDDGRARRGVEEQRGGQGGEKIMGERGKRQREESDEEGREGKLRGLGEQELMGGKQKRGGSTQNSRN